MGLARLTSDCYSPWKILKGPSRGKLVSIPAMSGSVTFTDLAMFNLEKLLDDKALPLNGP
jgi:hypothetical protein